MPCITTSISACARHAQMPSSAAFRSYYPSSPGSTVCFVTNIGEEKPQHEKKIRVTQQFMRDGEPLGNQVTDDMFETLRDESISQRDMEYWFNENEGDIEEEKFLKPLEEIENTDFTVRNEVWEKIIGIHLYHGAVIDLGTQYHGMIPVKQAQWPQVLDELTLERQVKVRVHAIRSPTFFRFPVQLELLEPDCSAHLTPAHEYEPPMIISPDMDPLEVVEQSGRDYEPSTYVQDDPEHLRDPILEKIKFKDMFGPAAEKPLQERYEAGELEGEELKAYEDWLESEEAQIMDVDALFQEEALSSHLARADFFSTGRGIDSSLDAYY